MKVKKTPRPFERVLTWHSMGMKKKRIKVKYWLVRPYLPPHHLPSHIHPQWNKKNQPKIPGKEINPTTKWHWLLSQEGKKLQRVHTAAWAKQMRTWWISGVGPLFTADEAGGFGVLSCLFSFSKVWDGMTPCLPTGSWLTSLPSIVLSDLKLKPNHKIQEKRHWRIAVAVSKARERENTHLLA